MICGIALDSGDTLYARRRPGQALCQVAHTAAHVHHVANAAHCAFAHNKRGKVDQLVLFLGREAARVMLPRGRGTLLFTGATASLRGGAGFAAFAGGKAALRALAQSMARELGPKGLHVAHVVIDGLIDTAFAREHFAQRVAEVGPDGILNPEHIAETYWWLHQQPRDAWTFELDLRPSVERW